MTGSPLHHFGGLGSFDGIDEFEDLDDDGHDGEGPSVVDGVVDGVVVVVNELDRLEAEGGACIMYTHFGLGFWDGHRLHPQFAELMTLLARRNGWFAPVSELLGYLLAQRGGQSVLQGAQRRELERRWLLHKIRFGTA